jgi:hypothetical protein
MMEKPHQVEFRQRVVDHVAEGNTHRSTAARFMVRQLPAYRFILCILNEVGAGYDDLVRHRCNSRRRTNPEHMEIESR